MVQPSMSEPPGGGLDFDSIIVSGCFNRSGSAVLKGDVVMFDTDLTATETTNLIPGDEASGFRNFVDPSAAGLLAGLFGVCVEDGGIADDASGKVLVMGVVDMHVTGSIVALTQIVPVAAAAGEGAAAAGSGREKVIALTLADEANNLAKCLFDGINGFGTDAT